jgi:type IV secretion system protein VirB9
VPPAVRVATANKAALQEPRADAYFNAIQMYPFIEGAIFRLYASPDKVSDIALQPGEQLIAISAGDTARWVIGDTHSGEATAKQVHILVKPYTSGLKTNLVVTTNRRTYHLQMESTPATTMAAIAWRYPQDELMTARAEEAKAVEAKPVIAGLVPADLNFRYALTGDRPNWRPLHVFDDGLKTYIVFPPTLGQGEAPPLFVVGSDGQAELVNYRVSKNAYVVDQIFGIAELRVGAKRQSVVRITRTDLPKARAGSVPGIGGGHD